VFSPSGGRASFAQPGKLPVSGRFIFALSPTIGEPS
jgi:hypothetical protein